MIELKSLNFENLYSVLQLKPNESQKEFVEEVTTTIALAYAGLMEKHEGELCVIYNDNEPVGVILIGKSIVGQQEPFILQKNNYVYRLMGFFIDYKHQNQGIGKKALKLVLNKIEGFQDGKTIPIVLEVKEENNSAIKLYESFGFYDTGTRYGNDCAFVRIPHTEEKL